MATFILTLDTHPNKYHEFLILYIIYWKVDLVHDHYVLLWKCYNGIYSTGQ